MTPPECKSHVRSVRKRSMTCKNVEELLLINDGVESDRWCRWRSCDDGVAVAVVVAVAVAALVFFADGGEESCPSIVLSGGPAEKLAPAIKTSDV